MIDQHVPATMPAGPHTQLINDKAPQWLIQASPECRAAIRAASTRSVPWLPKARTSSPEQVNELQRLYDEHRQKEQTVLSLLDRLPALETFARPLLTAAIKARFGLEVDVTHTWLLHARRATVDPSFQSASKDPMTQANVALRAATQPLLTTALQNFEAWETAPGAMDAESGMQAQVFASYEILGNAITGQPLPISPTGFAALCRELDLGGQYQTHLESLFNPPPLAGKTAQEAAQQIQADFMALEASSMKLQLLIALMKELISPPMYDALVQQLEDKKEVSLEGSPLMCSTLQLWNVGLNGIVVFGKDRESANHVEKIVVYIPDDPIAPLKEYESVVMFLNSLRDRMFIKGYLSFFKRFIPARHQGALLGKLFDHLHPKVHKNGILERQADKNARLDLRETRLTGPLLDNLYARKRAALKDDALFHGVPTAKQDQKSSAERVQYFTDKVFDALNIAAFVMPGLGEVMLAVTAAQLVHEVYEGVESWTYDDRQQAVAYLFDVVENIALMTALGAAGASAPGMAAVQVPDVVASLEAVELPNGATRLWKPDLTPFSHDIVLPDGLQPDALGLYHHQGKRWLPIDGKTYSVIPSSDGSGYAMEHPERPEGYQPPLRQNAAGTWLHALDRPLEIQGLTLFRRLGYSSKTFSDLTARRILEVSDTAESVMRQTLQDLDRPPALLEDTARRFKLDEELDRFIEHMQANDPDASPLLQLELLSQEPGWPDRRALQLLDNQGAQLRTFTPAHSIDPADTLSVRIDRPDVLRQALEGLSNAEAMTLLNEEFGAGQMGVSSRLTILRARLADRARTDRARLFEHQYHASETADIENGLPIRQAFPGLPNRIIEELVRHATPEELSQLADEQRVPLRIGEEANVYLQQVRLARAYEGLYLKSVSNPDTDRLILHSLETLPGWSAQIRLEVHERFFGGPLLDSVGPQAAPIRKVLIKEGDRYQTRDADDQHLHGLEDLYNAILHALPDAQRTQLGIPHTGQSHALERLIQQQPLARPALAPVLNMQAIKPGSRSPMRLADGRLGYTLSGRGNPDWHMTDESLLDKIRMLELDDAFAQEILSRLRHAGWNNRSIDQRLNALLEEQLVLRASMTRWTDEVVDFAPMTQAHVDSRMRISAAIWRHWRLNNMPEIGRTFEPLRLASVSLTDFPEHLPDFVHSRVTGLHLENITVDSRLPSGSEPTVSADTPLSRQLSSSEALGRFLRRFPNTRSLLLSSEPTTLLPPESSGFINLPRQVAGALPRLTELGLVNQGIFLDQSQMNVFRELPDLRRLDLSGNRLSAILPMDLGWLRLERLTLERTGLHGWPAWLNELIPGHVQELSVAHNTLTELPEHLLDNLPGLGLQTLIDIRGNHLSRPTTIRARINEAAPDRSFRFLMDIAPAVQAALEQQLQMGSVLTTALEQWAQAVHSLSGPTERTLEARRHIGTLIMDHWRTFSLGQIHTPLRLVNIALADFPPRLPDFFYRQVRYLHLSRVTGTPADLERLLLPLSELTSLEMDGHITPLTQLPQALLEIRSLRTLSLNDQGMLIDQGHIDFFSRIPTLERLELDNNRIGNLNSLSGLTRTGLNWLSLNNVGLSEWPVWINDLIPAPLRTLLLEGNLITDLPDAILANPENPHAHTEISLLNNPLSAATLQQAQRSERYGRSFSFDMDLPPEMIAMTRAARWGSNSSLSEYLSSTPDPDSPAPTPEPVTVDPWLDEAEPRSIDRRQMWEQLEGSEDARHLLDLIGSLRHTADYRNPSSRSTLVERVWNVLAAVSLDPQLRLTLNGIAEEPLTLFRNHNTCPDGVVLEFNQMEVLVFTRQSLRDVAPEQRGAQLYRLTRRLFRLSELDAIAREQAGNRDEAEVRLAYRTHWASALELPVPPESMLFEAHAAIRPGEFDQALLRVQSGEQGEAFLRYAAQQDYWVRYLREAWPDRFEVLERSYQNDLTRLTDEFERRQISLDHPEYEARIRELESLVKERQLTLIRELTNAESLEHP
ncbi:hypothetical protein G7013_06920 [Pseudomonas viridiflava]|uniref:NEL-type E3 ubiquitin ligase domain-containing protein n=1 Tax=Pseudomonas viridiflava TaxID=33069 RepID=UPI0015E2770C|nr:NEL-type E3 ubiquitin ligase domain-containing protein [Pseudomonas viridiflava]MBA1229379.1 hypothetical protein [Pseudomonas viridiflava]